jgi:serine/threonine-protein kinase
MSDKDPPIQGLPGEQEGEQSRKIREGFAPGELVGKRYKVIRTLGQGGMGVVYLVKDRKSGNVLALKTLLPEFAERKRAIVRFTREVSTARKLDHPSIVKIFDAWRVEDLLLYTMEYVEGVSLRQWLQKRGQLGLGSTVRILSMLCHALEHAHEITIHRDISPDNVMIRADGSVKLLDFGLAKQIDSSQVFTLIGTNLGKIDYSSPEQQANPTDVDGRADLYSLGIIFYELLTGKVPRGRITENLYDLRPDLPSECDSFLEKAVARNRDERFSDAREFRHALARLYRVYKRKNQAEAGHETAQQEAAPIVVEVQSSLWQHIIAWPRDMLKRLRRR